MVEEFSNIGHFLSYNRTFYIITLSNQKLIPKIITNIFQENGIFYEKIFNQQTKKTPNKIWRWHLLFNNVKKVFIPYIVIQHGLSLFLTFQVLALAVNFLVEWLTDDLLLVILCHS